jgi:hypothetical protein
MAAAFRRAGYAEFARRREYEANLAGLPPHGSAEGAEVAEVAGDM